jgi:hypothetical protein
MAFLLKRMERPCREFSPAFIASLPRALPQSHRAFHAIGFKLEKFGLLSDSMIFKKFLQ